MKENDAIIKTWDWRISRVGLTAQQFAEKAGIINTSLSHYKAGNQKPRQKQFEKIEKTLKALEAEMGIA
jgi:predicted transcriptional regulator